MTKKRVFCVCGNGLGSSGLCAATLNEICEDEGLTNLEILPKDIANALGEDCELIVSTKEHVDRFPPDQKTCIITNYVVEGVLRKEVFPTLKELNEA